MDFLNDLNCPQYINFKTDQNNSVISGVEDSACASLKYHTETENMDTEDENSYYLQNHSGSLQSTFSESYLGESSQEEIKSVVSSSPNQPEDFPTIRPNNLSLPGKAPKKYTKISKTTKVQPFHFAETKKRKREYEENNFVPLAEQVAAFCKKTPERFHTNRPKKYEPQEHWSPHAVIPKSPNLQAAKRQRRVDVISREEQEEKEAEEIKGYRFRARPVNKKTLHRPYLPQIRKKTPTKPSNLHLRTAQRAVEIHSKKKVVEKPYEFHAQPIPKAVLKGQVLKEKQSLPVTEAKTPNFALKKRAEKWKNQDKLNDFTTETGKFKALPAPAPSSPFVVKHEKKCTEIQPFSFDSKDKEKIAKKEKKIMEQIEKENEVFMFKAQPMPSPAPSTLPEVNKKPPTQPLPFSFQLENRSSKHSSFNSSLNQACPVFKAKPATVLEKPPFIPEKPARPSVEIKEFNLYTDIRASERQKLKEINDLKEHEKQLALQRLRELEEEEERREIERLRKEAVHKANPVRHYKPVEIKPSNKQLTLPQSPKFKTDERIQLRH